MNNTSIFISLWCKVIHSTSVTAHLHDRLLDTSDRRFNRPCVSIHPDIHEPQIQYESLSLWPLIVANHLSVAFSGFGQAGHLLDASSIHLPIRILWNLFMCLKAHYASDVYPLVYWIQFAHVGPSACQLILKYVYYCIATCQVIPVGRWLNTLEIQPSLISGW